MRAFLFRRPNRLVQHFFARRERISTGEGYPIYLFISRRAFALWVVALEKRIPAVNDHPAGTPAAGYDQTCGIALDRSGGNGPKKIATSTEERTMYAVIRRYVFNPIHAEEINRKVREGFVPLIKETPGFISYYWLDSGQGTAASVGVFMEKARSEESIRLAEEFVHRELGDMLGTPEITHGLVQAHA
jgi:hypothetical protein